MKSAMAAAQSKITFEETFDPFPSEDVFEKDDSCMGQKYKELSKDLFGDTEERMIILIKEFKEATKKEMIEIPDSDHFCRRFLRAGGCDVTEAIKVLHSYLSVYHLCPHYYEDLLPLGKNEKRQIWPESIHLESWKVGPQQGSLRDDLLCRLQHDGANFT